MQNVKILIVEDELIIAEKLRIFLTRLGYQIAGIFVSGVDVLKKIDQLSVDIIFMDIHLADDSNGIDVAKQLKKICDIPVIFLTQNPDQQLRRKAIYETNAVHYLLKPFNKAQVSIAIDFALKSMKDVEFTAVKSNDSGYLMKDSIFLKNGVGYKKIMISDVMYIEADGSYCKFVFGDNKYQVFSENLSYFGEKLEFAKELLRIHRSYIVNVNLIERVHENRVWVNGKEVPIGRSYKSEFLKKVRFI